MTVLSIPGNASASIFPEDFSSTDNVLNKGSQWNKEGGVKSVVGGHLLVPITTIATSALDALVHALGAVMKTAVFVPKAIVYAVTLGNVDIAPGASLTAICKHVGRSVGYVSMVAVAPLTSLFSCDAALSVLQGLGLAPAPAPIKSKGVWQEAWEQDGVTAKASYLWNNIGRVAASPVDGAKWASEQVGAKTSAGIAGLGIMAAIAEVGGRYLTPVVEEVQDQSEEVAVTGNYFQGLRNVGNTILEQGGNAGNAVLCATPFFNRYGSCGTEGAGTGTEGAGTGAGTGTEDVGTGAGTDTTPAAE